MNPVIIAGGSGTRLWPLSRQHHPKQFLPIMSGRTMLQETVGRLDGMRDTAAPVFVCNEAHRFLVSDQLREIGVHPLEIIVEPAGRNTAPALTLAALRLLERSDDPGLDPVMLVMPADHVVRDAGTFRAAVAVAAPIAEGGLLVTFGVVPTGPETGYGYVRKGPALNGSGQRRRDGDGSSPTEADLGAHEVSGFVEKPDLATAEQYVSTSAYLWNSGIFMMRASVWLSELERYRPDIARSCRAARSSGDVDGDFFRPGSSDFLACPSDSIDYAVMEKAADGTGGDGASARCAVVPLDAGWSDIGAWSALWQEREQDDQGNVVQGDVYAQSTTNTLLISQHRLLAAVGLEDTVVVETTDAVLVARKDRVQDVKEIVQRLKADERPESESHRKVHRPWGTYEVVDTGPGFQVKRLTVNPGDALSLQMHHHRAEHWVVVGGTAKVTKGDESFVLGENESAYVPKEVSHRLENPGKVPLEIIEVQTGSYLGEDDIVRFQDDYNRHTQS